MTGLSDASGEGAFGPVIQPDGRILVCDTRTTSGTSNWDFVVARFNANGTLDTGFNFNGLVGIDFNSGFDYCTGIALQADGKIVVAGSTYASGSQDFAVARLQPNGALDPTFGAGTGKVTVSFDLGGLIDVGKAVAIQSDGKIIVAGSASTASDGTDFAVVRLLPDGTRDAAFNLTGRVTFGFDVPGNNSNDAALAVAIDGAGRIVLGGNTSRTNGGIPSSDFALARLLPNGQLDPNFDADGRAKVAFDLGASGDDQFKALTIQTDGRIVVAGGADTSLTSAVNYDMAVARVLPNGALDNSFGIGGRTLVPFDLVAQGADLAFGIAQQPDGKLTLAGAATGMGGSLDEIFGAAVRLHADGSLDNGFGVLGKQTYDFGLFAPTGQILHGVAFQGTQIVIAGASRVPWGAGVGVDNLVLRLGEDRIFASGFD